MTTPFIGQVSLFAGNFAPRGWAFCEGQLLPISSHSALFSIIGTIYGGDGETTFGLPDFRDRVSVGAGAGPGLSPATLGARGGADEVALTPAQMPPHTHTLQGSDGEADEEGTRNPAGMLLGRPRPGSAIYGSSAAGTVAMDSLGASSGGSVAHENRQPTLAVSYIIALEGIYPS